MRATMLLANVDVMGQYHLKISSCISHYHN